MPSKIGRISSHSFKVMSASATSPWLRAMVAEVFWMRKQRGKERQDQEWNSSGYKSSNYSFNYGIQFFYLFYLLSFYLWTYFWIYLSSSNNLLMSLVVLWIIRQASLYSPLLRAMIARQLSIASSTNLLHCLRSIKELFLYYSIVFLNSQFFFVWQQKYNRFTNPRNGLSGLAYLQCLTALSKFRVISSASPSCSFMYFEDSPSSLKELTVSARLFLTSSLDLFDNLATSFTTASLYVSYICKEKRRSISFLTQHLLRQKQSQSLIILRLPFVASLEYLNSVCLRLYSKPMVLQVRWISLAERSTLSTPQRFNRLNIILFWSMQNPMSTFSRQSLIFFRTLMQSLQQLGSRAKEGTLELALVQPSRKVENIVFYPVESLRISTSSFESLSQTMNY